MPPLGGGVHFSEPLVGDALSCGASSLFKQSTGLFENSPLAERRSKKCFALCGERVKGDFCGKVPLDNPRKRTFSVFGFRLRDTLKRGMTPLFQKRIIPRADRVNAPVCLRHQGSDYLFIPVLGVFVEKSQRARYLHDNRGHIVTDT